ncbi:MAG: putative zinc-binding protein [Candidatus Helarchaeota archaeon]
MEKRNILFIPCSGAEYNGELARHVVIQLSEISPIAEISSVLCLTIFLKYHLLNKERLFEIMKKNIASNFSVVIDGCSGSCALHLLKTLDVKPDLVINLRKLVPKPTINFNDLQAFLNQPRMSNLKQEDIEKVTTYVLNQLSERKIIDLREYDIKPKEEKREKMMSC